MRSTVVFEGLKLTTPGTGGNLDPERVYSRAVSMTGANAVFATLTILEIDEDDGVVVWLQGSSNLENWDDIGAIVSGSSVGATQGQIAAVPSAYVRVGVIETSATPTHAMIALTLDTWPL